MSGPSCRPAAGHLDRWLCFPKVGQAPPGPSPRSLPTFPFLSPALDMGAPLISSVPASAPPHFSGFRSLQSQAQTTLLISRHYLSSAWCPITCFSLFTLNAPKLSPSPMLFPPCSVPCSRGSWWHGCHSSLSNPRSCCLVFPSSPQSCLFLPSPMIPLLLFWGTVTSALAASLPYPSHSLGRLRPAVSPGGSRGSGQYPPTNSPFLSACSQFLL